MALILDTNALSAFADGDAKLLRVVEREDEFALPAIALGEYLYGIRQSRFRARYDHWLDVNLPLFDVLAVGRDTAQRYADIRQELKVSGQPIPSNDLWIAALAREYGLPVVSRDSHFQTVRGLRVLAW